MKQKIIYVVLFVAAMYLPASSKECAKVIKCGVTENLVQTKEKIAPAASEMQEAGLPVSPFSRLLFNL
ncbi:MAG: hypothetical protein ABJB86_09850 [Bacteroidota bacterium]